MAASEEIVELARGAALKAAEIKPTSITAIDVSERLILTEVFLVISAGSQPQMRGLVDAVDRAMHEAGRSSAGARASKLKCTGFCSITAI